MNAEVKTLQTWLNNRYGSNSNFVQVDEDGIVGYKTYKALIRAVQIELNVSPVDGLWGDGTSAAFPSLSINSDSSDEKTSRLIYILQGGFFCKGIHPGGLDGVFGESTKAAVETLETQAGLTTTTGVASGMIMKALLSTDAYTLLDGGDAKIRTIQQALNDKYNAYIGLIPCDGIYTRTSSRAMIKAIQVEHKKQYPSVTVDGIWGADTRKKCPTLQRHGTITNKQYVYLLQYALYINGYDPNGFDGGFGAGVQKAATNFQAFVGLTADGVVGPQTWASLMVSYGDPNRTCKAADCMTPLTEHTAALLVEKGRTTIGRYIVGGSNKCLTEDELKIIKAAGLKLLPIYQLNARGVDKFTRSTGLFGGYKAYEQYKALKLPDGGTVYFAVDYDVMQREITSNIIPYFQGIKDRLEELGNTSFSIGVYGPRYVCTRLYEAGLTTSSFVSDMSSGYSCNIGYPLPKNWSFDQILNTEISNDYWSLEIDNDLICSARDTSLDLSVGSASAPTATAARYKAISAVQAAMGWQVDPLSTSLNFNIDQCLVETPYFEMWLSVKEGVVKADPLNPLAINFTVSNGGVSLAAVAKYENLALQYPAISTNRFNITNLAAAVKLGSITLSFSRGATKAGLSAQVWSITANMTATTDNNLECDTAITYKYVMADDFNVSQVNAAVKEKLSASEMEQVSSIWDSIQSYFKDPSAFPDADPLGVGIAYENYSNLVNGECLTAASEMLSFLVALLIGMGLLLLV